MRNAIIGSVIVIFISAGIGRAATFSEEAPELLMLEKVKVLECQFVAHARVIMYFVMEKVVDNGHGRQPPIQAWKVPVTEQGQPNFKKATLMAIMPQGCKVRKPFVFVSIVDDRVFCLYKFRDNICESCSFVTFLLSEEFSVFHKRYKWKTDFIACDDEIHFSCLRRLKYISNSSVSSVDTRLVDILAITVGEKDKIVITAINKNQKVVVVESVDNGKTWALPRVLDVSQATVSNGLAPREATEQKK